MKDLERERSCERNPAGRALTAGLLCAGLWLGAAAAADTGLEQRLDAVLDRWVASERIVGVTALVLRDGEPVYRRAAGYADREAGRPAKQDTIYRLASMTKAIVSATALALVVDGRLSLNDRVADWLPYFRPRLPDGRTPDITVRLLMSHTSGLSYAVFEPHDSPWRRAEVPAGLHQDGESLEEAMRRIASVPLVFAPGTDWRYSVATDVLGAVVASASGTTLPEAVAHYVTGPLGMSDTTFVVTEPARLAAAYRDGAQVATRMREDGDTVPVSEEGVPFSPGRATDPDAWPSGGGGMSGTAADYARFLEVIRTGGAPILSPASAELLTTHQIGVRRAWSEGEGWGHGLGAAVLLDREAAGTPQNAGTWQWGGVLGAHWFVDPVEAPTVVVLTNTSIAGVIGEFPVEVRDAIYGVGAWSTN